MPQDEIKIALTESEALVLFELVSTFSDEGVLEIRHAAEERVLWDICCTLESVLTAPLSETYGEQLAKARQEVIQEQHHRIRTLPAT
jgi:hypothetical protein